MERRRPCARGLQEERKTGKAGALLESGLHLPSFKATDWASLLNTV